jgi:hypothetical protein
MSLPAPKSTSKLLEPIHPGFIESLRIAAQSVGMNADEMAQETFSRPLERLTVAEGFKLNCRVYAAINAARTDKGTGQCFQCGTPLPFGGSECRPCHEGMTTGQYARTMRREFLTEPEALPRHLAGGQL